MITAVCGTVAAGAGAIYAVLHLIEWWKSRNRPNLLEDCLEIIKAAQGKATQ